MASFLVFALTLLLVAPSCTGNKQEEILVFAAASLTDVMEQVGERFQDSAGVKVRFNLGGSTALAQQIIRGAPADAFISAGPGPMDTLADRGLIMLETRADVLGNGLVLVARAGGDGGTEFGSLEDLADGDARVAIADPELAPAGRYAREALISLGLWGELKHRLVLAPDVRAALGYLQTGNVGAGIVYRTDADVAEGLQIIASVPENFHTPILYPAAVSARSRHVTAAGQFILFLIGEEARETFREYGFIPHTGD